MDLRLLNLLLRLATSTEACVFLEHFIIVGVGDTGVEAEDDEDDVIELLELECEKRLALLSDDDEEADDAEAECARPDEDEEEEADFSMGDNALSAWHTLAIHGVIKLPDIAKKMDDSLDAKFL